VCWSCSICKTTKSIRDGSFLLQVETPLTEVASCTAVVGMHGSSLSLILQMKQKLVSTACDIYQWLREVCSTKLLESPVVLGGPGVVVQIDESKV